MTRIMKILPYKTKANDPKKELEEKGQTIPIFFRTSVVNTNEGPAMVTFVEHIKTSKENVIELKKLANQLIMLSGKIVSEYK